MTSADKIQPMDLTERRIVVTGASSGIGRETAILLSRLGARLVLVARDSERLNQTCAALHGDGHEIHAIDLSNIDPLPDWLESLAGRGTLHGLVHAAGVHAVLPLRVLSSAEIDRMFKINVYAAMALAKGFRRAAVSARPASVVFVASVMGLVGQPALSTYCATKGAVVAMTRSLGVELAREGIRVNAVAPGQVVGEMTDRQRSSLTQAQLEAFARQHPLGLGTPQDVAQAVAFLLADSGRWITGSTLVVDGGYTAQ